MDGQKETVTIHDMIRKHLEDNGYDGLVSNECGCILEELAPCEYMEDCKAAYKWPGDEGSPFYMRTIKP